MVRAAVCIACGLWSLTSPAFAQNPAPTPGSQSLTREPLQGGKPVEYREPPLAAPDEAISDDSALTNPGNEGMGKEVPRSAVEQELLRLLLEEKRRLVYYGPKHPDVVSIRERIQAIRKHLAQHPPAPPPTTLAPLPPISVQTPPSLFPLVSSQITKPDGTEEGTAATNRDGNARTATSRSRPEPIRPARFSTSANSNLDPATAPPGLGDPPPTVGETKHEDTHSAAIASTNPSTPAVVPPPKGGGDKSASQPPQEQPRKTSFFETGFGQLIGIVGAILLGVLIQLIALALILRRYSALLAQVFRVELVNPASVTFVGQESAAAAQSVPAGPATKELTHSSTTEVFDIGPTYEEEMRQKQEALDQQEKAVLQHIFELNMQMREQLGQKSAGAA